MNLERITTSSHAMYLPALDLYRKSFPFHEQREAASQAAILTDNAYHFDLIWDDNTFAGLILYWETSDFVYVEHLCISPEMRGCGYGQQVLSLLQKRHKTIFLEIDPPIDAISIRRKGFYQRCGFVENPYPHIHPPYHKHHQGHSLVLMSHPHPVSPQEYDCFQTYLKTRIMDRAFA